MVPNSVFSIVFLLIVSPGETLTSYPFQSTFRANFTPYTAGSLHSGSLSARREYSTVPRRPILCENSLKSASTLSHGVTRTKSTTTLYSVLAPPPTLVNEKSRQKVKQLLSSPRRKRDFIVRIFNDSLNTREHVARSLVKVTSLPESTAYSVMMSAHKHGVAIVGSWHLEQAEMLCEQLKDQGLVADITEAGDE